MSTQKQDSTTSADVSLAMNEIRAGETRIRDGDGFVGTVMYVGPVASAKKPKEIYVGVAWDDETRGIHDGSVISRKTNQIVRHFSCKPSAGSFLRILKVDFGVEINEVVLRSRYVTTDAPVVAPNNILPHSALTASGREKPIEFLGELQIRARQQLPTLNAISLRSMGISRASTSSMEEYHRLTDMDLAGNLLSNWDTVFAILRQFPMLCKVSLAFNRIRDIPSSLNINSREFSRITELNLNDCGIKSFRTILSLARVIPSLTELCIAHNDLSDINSCRLDQTSDQRIETGECHNMQLANMFRHLQYLDCSSCNMTSWESQVSLLSGLPKLQQLILNDNPIECIPSTKGSPHHFGHLQALHLSGVSVETWSDLDGLLSLKTLKSLHFRNAPLTRRMGTGEARTTVIARIPQIEQLNATPISSKERIEAERRYVANVARELLRLSRPNTTDEDTVEETKLRKEREEEMRRQHPRFDALVEKHKDTMMLASADHGAAFGGSVLAGNAINVTIRSMAASSCSMEPLQKRIPSALSVGRIKAMCSRAFQLEMDLQILHVRNENDAFPIELDDDDRALSYYGVSDGMEILMNEIDMEALRCQEEREGKQHEQRIMEQEKIAIAMQELQKGRKILPITTQSSDKSLH